MAVDSYGFGEPEAWQPPQTADRASSSCPGPAVLPARIDGLTSAAVRVLWPTTGLHYAVRRAQRTATERPPNLA